jgi:MFS family permease
MASSAWENITVAYRVRGYRLYQIGRLSFQTTTWMYRISVAWLVWDLTHSATWLGIFGFLDNGPAILIAPMAGALIDRMDRMTWMRTTQSLMLVQSLVLTALVYFDLLTIEILAINSLFFGIVMAAQMPATQAIIPSLMPKEHLTTAYGLNSITFNISRFGGPVLAGLVINAWGVAPAILCNALGTGVLSICLALIKGDFNAAIKRKEGRPRVLDDLREGLTYAFRHPGIGPLISVLGLMSVFAFFIDQLLPNFADGVFHAGAHGLSMMMSAVGVGAFLQAALLARRPGIAGMTGYVFRSILIFAVGLIALTQVTSIWPAVFVMVFLGYSGSVIRVGCMTLLQYSVDADMRGRVASFFTVIYFVGPALGSVVIGKLSDLFGIQTIVLIAGCATLGVWVFARYRQAAMAPALEATAKA